MAQEEKCILMEFDYWHNSPLSIAKYYGGIVINQQRYVITDEPYDLIREDFEEFYKALGRQAFLQIITDNYQASTAEIKKIFKSKITDE